MKLLKYGSQFVTTVLAAFHGFLLHLSPPEEVRKSASVGFSSFILLIVFLCITSIASRTVGPTSYKRWLYAVIVCVILGTASFFLYLRETNQLTFFFPPGVQGAEMYVKGTELTPEAKAYKAAHSGITDSDLVDDYGGVGYKDLVWTHESIGAAENKLTASYALFVVILTTAVLCVLEGLLGTHQVPALGAPRPRVGPRQHP